MGRQFAVRLSDTVCLEGRAWVVASGDMAPVNGYKRSHRDKTMCAYLRLLLLCCVAFHAAVVRAEVLNVEGTVKKVDAKDRSITFLQEKSGGRPFKEKTRIELQVPQQAVVTLGDWPIAVEDIEVGDKVALKYDPDSKVVTELTKDARVEAHYTKWLKKKMSASKIEFRPESGWLSLTYDFSKVSQLKDFDTSQGMPNIASGGVLRISAAESLPHVARFAQVSISGTFKVRNTGDFTEIVGFTNGASLKKRQWGNEFLLKVGDKEALTPTAPNSTYAIRMTRNERKVHAKMNQAELGLPCSNEGSVAVVFHGGQVGIEVTGVVIAGTVDSAWFKEFMTK
jgi:hypothetical protein